MNLHALQHEKTANNLANANTTGFRRQLLVVGANPIESMSGQHPVTSHVDFSQGSIIDTGNPLDLALEGDGFFVIDTPEGNRYTRSGNFRLNDAGNLVTTDGHQVLAGGPVTIPPGANFSSITVSREGAVFADGNEIAKLDIVGFDDLQNLVPVGSNLFRYNGEQAPAPTEAVVVQGALESSNTSIVHEMISMIVGMRQFEAAQQAIKSISESMQRYTTLDL